MFSHSFALSLCYHCTLQLVELAGKIGDITAPNDGIHLAITAPCGKFGGGFTNANAGIKLRAFKTMVAFGDSYTDGGRHDGGPLAPAVLVGNSTRAGGRITNGPVWIEHVANRSHTLLMDYAISGALTNTSLWPSRAGSADFVGEVQTFLSQGNDLDPDETLYLGFFGINDWSSIDVLRLPPTSATNFLVLDDYGRGTENAAGDAFKQAVFNGVSALSEEGLNVAFVDFAPLWTAILGDDPGFAAFGYTSDGSCFPTAGQLTTDGECEDSRHTFYWLHGHPSNETHKIMADYVDEVLTLCRA
ncbi:carbohydrate esterase family 16 protein [Vararia minispora EC-137]|uniref:Carbohydrate esterase family 16 protein n=1 Tax=Vararia minispora EC-137 TaxID=1314806 RepID=A0ACB8QPE3_9AGAM|nr:carbohydrate esterase family 16 protein [Vararia minispora EC-137]